MSDRPGLFPGALELMVLRTLTRGPLHGYALVRQIRERSGDELVIEEGSLYPTLQRLLRARLVSASWGTSSTNRRVRLYQLTAAGRRHLVRETSSFEKMLNAVSRVLLPNLS